MSANIPTELLVTLLETKKWTETKVFIYAQKEPEFYRRVIKLISIHQIINDKSIKKEVIDKALEIASNIQDDYERAKALSAIVSHLDGQRKEELMEKSLEIASNIQDDYERAKALSAIVSHLDGQRKEELMEKALEIASMIQSDYERAKALFFVLSLMRNSPINKLYFWWKKIIQILREYTRSNLLFSIITLIPVINDLGKDETLFEISRAIIDVSNWFL